MTTKQKSDREQYPTTTTTTHSEPTQTNPNLQYSIFERFTSFSLCGSLDICINSDYNKSDNCIKNKKMMPSSDHHDPTATNNHNSNNSQNVMGRFFQQANKTIHHFTTKKYMLPDKIVASQILMYRQLLHTSCRVGLVLSRPYEATPAQLSVQHMPWWETTTTVITTETAETTDSYDTNITTTTNTPTTTTTTTKTITMVDTGKMVISYENLIQRLWKYGLTPYYDAATDTNQHPKGILDVSATKTMTMTDSIHTTTTAMVETTTTNLPSLTIPHGLWVTTLGFQQPDPVTDFRSGGILSLALMVWIVEHCPTTYQKFISSSKRQNDNTTTTTTTATVTTTHPASVLPFGITSINITDMIAKLLMLSKKFDRMDALMSQKPFWPLFNDPYAILTCQELSMELLCIVVQEIVTIRQVEAEIRGTTNHTNNNSRHNPRETVPVNMDVLTGSPTNHAPTTPTNTSSSNGKETNEYSKYISVFDFTHILSVTEERVEYDLLGSGPRTIQELRSNIFEQTLIPKYQQQLDNKIQKLRNDANKSNTTKTMNDTPTTSTAPIATTIPIDTMELNDPNASSSLPEPTQQQQHLHEKVLHHATHGIGHLFSSVSHNPLWNGMNHILSQPKNHKNDKPSSSDALNNNVEGTDTIIHPEPHAQTMVDFLDTEVNDNNDSNDDWMNHHESNHNPSQPSSDSHNNNNLFDMFDAVDLNDPYPTATATPTMPNHNNTIPDTTSSVFCITDD